MSATDKNGVELKIGQIVIIPGVDMAKIVSIEGKRIGLNHKSNTFYFNSRVLEFAEFETLMDTVPARTYTETEIRKAIIIGLSKRMIPGIAGHIQNVIDALNAPKP